MKKILVLLMSLLLITVLATGCSQAPEEADKTPEPADQSPVSTIENELLRDAEAKMLEALAPLPTMGNGEKIGAIAFSMTNPFWVTVEDGYKDAAKEYGVTVDVVAASKRRRNWQAEAFNI